MKGNAGRTLRIAGLWATLALAACGGDNGSGVDHNGTASKAPADDAATLTAQDSAELQQTGGSTSKKALISASSSLSLGSGTHNRLYGPGTFVQNALANTVIGTTGGTNRIVSNRFRATVSGHLQSVRLYWQPGKGYSSGNGGRIRIRLMPDDGSSRNLPNLNAAPLASTVYAPGSSKVNAGKPIFDEIRITSHAAIQAGRIYHLVLDNVDSSPASNYISSNNAITVAGNGRPARWLSPTDWATLLGTSWSANGSRTWRDLTRDGASNQYYAPILQMRLTNGQSQGVSNMEGGSVDPKLVFTATASAPVRERFTPWNTKRVSGLSFRTAASVGGSLRWRIMEGSTVLATGRISSSSPNYKHLYTRNGTRIAGLTWYDVNLPKTLTLNAGRTYDIEFRPEGSSQWKFADARNGSHHGFSWPAAFTQSKAQHYRYGSWRDAYHWDYNQSRGDSNWPVVLHTH